MIIQNNEELYTTQEINKIINFSDPTGRGSGQKRLVPRCKRAGLEIEPINVKNKERNQLFYKIISNNIDLPEEKWIQCYCKRDYEVSDLGRVRKINGKGLLGNYSNSGGYKTISSYFDDSKQMTQFLVHRLIFFSFHPEYIPYEKEICIDHINGKRDDNRLINLQPLSTTNNIVKRDVDQANTKSILANLIQKYNYDVLQDILNELLKENYIITEQGIVKK